jgi:hypothetical protein
MELVSDCLKFKFDFNETTEYFFDVETKPIFRSFLINGKRHSLVETYKFWKKHGLLT